MIKKRTFHFFIVEVLIAFLLISMTIIPFSSYPYKTFTKQIKHLESLSIEPYFIPTFLEVVQTLDNEEVNLAPIEIPFGPNETLTLVRTAKISKKYDPSKSPSALFTIDITFKTPHLYKERQVKFFIKNPEVA